MNGSPGNGNVTTAPVVQSISPATVVVGAPDTKLTLNGINFTNTTAVAVNGVAESTSYVSASQVTAIVPSAQMATAASLNLTASNGSSVSAPIGFTIANPLPAISSLSAVAVTAGTMPGTITVTGTGFVASSTVSVNGMGHPTSYVDATHLSFSLTTTDMAGTGTLAVAVTNTAPGGGISAVAQIHVVPPTPTVSSLSPSTVPAGATDTVVMLTGTGFTSATSVSLNGVTLVSVYVNATQVKATIPAVWLANAATFPLTATNGNGSGTSAPANFAVNNPLPVITSLSTQSLTAGITSQTITIMGTGFVQASSVLLNGSARSTTYISGTQLSFKPTDADISLPGALAIAVNNGMPGGGTSAVLDITVAAGSPAVSSISPNSILAASSDTTVTVTGTNFLTTSVVMTGTVALTTNYVSNTQLTAIVPASNLASLGWLPIFVRTPSATSTSTSVAIPIVLKLQLNANHIVYDQYTRKLWATISAAVNTLPGPSLVSIDPATGTIGAPIPLSSTANGLVLSDSGKTLYALTPTSVIRYDLTTKVLSSAAIPGQTGGPNSSAIYGPTIAPGTENELVLGISSGGTTSIQVYDYDTGANTVTARPGSASTASHYGYCPVFLNPDYLVNPYNTIGRIDLYPVTSSGLVSSSATYNATSSAENTGCMKTVGNVGYSSTGNVYAFTPTSITKSATVDLSPTTVGSLLGSPVAPDPSLHQVFFGTVSGVGGPESLTSASTDTNQLTSVVTLPTLSMPSSGPSNYADDLFRWGQDGLALLLRGDIGSIGANLYLLRGPFVVPQELNTNKAALITSVSSGTLKVGSGNTILTITGSNFLQGVAVTWNGSYRTTTIGDSNHITVAIPTSDLAEASAGTVVVVNPGAPASSSLTVMVQ